MKRLHAPIMIAMANDSSLVRLVRFKFDKDNVWVRPVQPADQGILFFNDECEYYLCQPKHVESCLWFLNGGLVQVEGIKAIRPKVGIEWSSDHVFMDEDLTIKAIEAE